MYVYVIESTVDGRYYVGMRENVQLRLKAHNAGRTKSTKGFRPWLLIHTEQFETRIDARRREKYLKSGFGKQWLKHKYKSVL